MLVKNDDFWRLDCTGEPGGTRRLRTFGDINFLQEIWFHGHIRGHMHAMGELGAFKETNFLWYDGSIRRTPGTGGCGKVLG